MSATEIAQGIERVVAGHDEIGSPLRRFLRPGSETVGLVTEVDGAPGSRSITALWNTWDGVDPEVLRQFGQERIWLFSTAVWLPSRAAAERYKWLMMNRASINPTTRPEEVWAEHWYPVFELNGDLVAVDLSTPEGAVWIVRFEDLGEVDRTRRLSDSLARFLNGTARQFERGLYTWDRAGGSLAAADGTWVDLFEEGTG